MLWSSCSLRQVGCPWGAPSLPHLGLELLLPLLTVAAFCVSVHQVKLPWLQVLVLWPQVVGALRGPLVPLCGCVPSRGSLVWVCALPGVPCVGCMPPVALTRPWEGDPQVTDGEAGMKAMEELLCGAEPMEQDGLSGPGPWRVGPVSVFVRWLGCALV